MDELFVIQLMSMLMIIAGLFTFHHLVSGNRAPYGRYSKDDRALMSIQMEVNANVAWVIQELPSFAVPVYIIYCTTAVQYGNIINQVILGMFLVHYFQRTFIFSMLIRGGKPTPLVSFVAAVLFCSYNGYIQGRYHTQYGVYPDSWTQQINYQLGLLVFAAGMIINIHSDHVLRNLRKPGETGYKIPRGGMFEYISGANFFGEILEWVGYAIASWSLPALAFMIFTICNIGPRAVAHHKWYLDKFGKEYPRSRKAVIPFVL